MSKVAFGTIFATRTFLDTGELRLSVGLATKPVYLNDGSSDFDTDLVLEFDSLNTMQAFMACAGIDEANDNEEIQLLKDKLEEAQHEARDFRADNDNLKEEIQAIANSLQAVADDAEATSHGIMIVDEYEFGKLDDIISEMECL